MHDHLKDAADASGLTDRQLEAVCRKICNVENPSGFEQAVLDELGRRQRLVRPEGSPDMHPAGH